MSRCSWLLKYKDKDLIIQGTETEMAAEQILQGLSEDFLQCSICMNRYQTPLMLPCLHSFCSNCLEKWKTTAAQRKHPLSCPTCRRHVQLPSTGVKGLPNNFLLTSLMERLDLVGKLSKEKSSNCDFCQNGKSSLFCIDCQLHLCATCQVGHSRIPGAGEHALIAAAKVSDASYWKEVTSKKPPRCGNHPQEKLRFYCTTCTTLVCRDCTILNHQGHKCCEAEQEVAEAKNSIEIHLKENQSLVQSTQQGCEKLNKLIKLTETHKATLKSQIDNQYDKYVKILNAQRNVLYQELERVTEEKTKKITETLSLSKQWLKATENTQKITKQVLERNNIWEILGIATSLSGSYATLKQEHLDVTEQSKNAEAKASNVNKMIFIPTTSLHSHSTCEGCDSGLPHRCNTGIETNYRDYHSASRYSYSTRKIHDSGLTDNSRLLGKFSQSALPPPIKPVPANCQSLHSYFTVPLLQSGELVDTLPTRTGVSTDFCRLGPHYQN